MEEIAKLSSRLESEIVSLRKGGREMGDAASVTLPETNIAPENGPKPKRKQSYSNHPFSGAKMFVSWSVLLIIRCGACGIKVKVRSWKCGWHVCNSVYRNMEILCCWS